MKHFVMRLVLIIIVCMTAVSSHAQRATIKNTALYKSTSTASGIITSVKAGTSVSVLRAVNSGWSEVTVDGRHGYMPASAIGWKQKQPNSGGDVKPASPSPNPRPTSEPKPSNTKEMSGEQIYDRYNDAVFKIVTTPDGEDIFQGSGFFIDKGGIAVTNYHVLEGQVIAVLKMPNGDTEVIDVEDAMVTFNKDKDFAIFTVGYSNKAYIPLSQHSLRIGERVYAIGCPKGLENIISEGLVSQVYDDIIQTTVNIDHGSSGGVLINKYGEAVGITSGTLDATSSANLNYAWSVDVFRDTLEKIKSYKRKNHIY